MKKLLLLCFLALSLPTATRAETCNSAMVSIDCQLPNSDRELRYFQGIFTTPNEGSSEISGIAVPVRSSSSGKLTLSDAEVLRKGLKSRSCHIYRYNFWGEVKRDELSSWGAEEAHFISKTSKNIFFIPFSPRALKLGNCPAGSWISSEKQNRPHIRFWSGINGTRLHWTALVDLAQVKTPGQWFSFDKTGFGVFKNQSTVHSTHETGIVTDEETKTLLGSYTASMRFSDRSIKTGFVDYLKTETPIFIPQPFKPQAAEVESQASANPPESELFIPEQYGDDWER